MTNGDMYTEVSIEDGRRCRLRAADRTTPLDGVPHFGARSSQFDDCAYRFAVPSRASKEDYGHRC
eukprot:2826726-Rhodomonas_salina.1